MAKKGSSGGYGGVLGKIIGLLIVSYFIISMLPNITSNYNSMASDTTNFTAQQLVLIGLFAVITVLAVFWLVIKYTGLAK